MTAIKNVTIVGGSGRLGTFILQKLVASNKFNVQALKRSGSSSTFPDGVAVVESDYENVDSLKSAFQGQDAVVSVIGDAGVLSQKAMVDAAVAAGVKRFLPSNFGSNMSNPNSRKLPVFGRKVVVEDYLVEKSKTTDLTYSFVYVGGLTDFGIKGKVIMDLSQYTPKIFNGGEAEFSTTSMPTVGDAVVGVLSHPEETKNRAVYTSEATFSQQYLLSLAKKAAPNKPWAPVDVDLDVVVQGAMKRLAEGNHDLHTVIPILLKSIVDPEYGSNFTVNDNELLGIKPATEEYLTKLVASTIPE
jgi:uncharacterized protein YbjT (DUF2867 family)